MIQRLLCAKRLRFMENKSLLLEAHKRAEGEIAIKEKAIVKLEYYNSHKNRPLWWLPVTDVREKPFPRAMLKWPRKFSIEYWQMHHAHKNRLSLVLREIPRICFNRSLSLFHSSSFYLSLSRSSSSCSFLPMHIALDTINIGNMTSQSTDRTRNCFKDKSANKRQW